MPCALTTGDNETYCGTKLVTLFPKNASPLPVIQGVIVLFGQQEKGQALALIEASAVTALRTAAASGLATKLLAREDSKTCAIIGSGVQAESHVAAMLVARPFTSFTFANRTASKLAPLLAALKKKYSKTHPQVTFKACDSVEEAVKEADVVCTVTGSATPILLSVRPGTHINAVGAHGKAKREIDGPLVAKASVWADIKASTLAEGGDFLIPLGEKLFTESHLKGDLSDLVTRTTPARTSAQEITMFNSLGVAIEDLQCAIYLYKAAKKALSRSVRLMSRL